MHKVLYFGNLPKWIGGRQTSGASVVMWQLATSINALNTNYKVEFVATDVFEEKKQIDNTIVYGWNNLFLLRNFFASFLSSFQYVFVAKKLSKENELPFFLGFVKLIFFHSIVKKNKESLFHVHGTDYFVVLKEVLKKNKISSLCLLYTIHAIGGIDSNIADYKVEQKKEQQIADYTFGGLFFVSKELQNEWNNFYGFKDSTVISNAIANEYLNVQIDTNRDYASSTLTLVTIGSLSDRKGQIRVLEAIAKSENKDKFIYKCIGSSNDVYLQKLKSIAFENNIAFEFLGTMNALGIIEVLQKAHYMILPSSSEGFGLVYLESLCTGAPVILPKNLPIVKEISLSSVNSILLEDSSVDAILQVLNTIDNSDFNSQNVANSFLKLSWNDVSKNYVEQYKMIYEKAG